MRRFGCEREQPLEVVGRPVEVRLEHGADVRVTRGAEPLVDPQRRLDELGLLHVDADEVAARVRVGDETLDVLVGGVLVEGQAEVRELQRDVRTQLLLGKPVEHLDV